MGGRTPLLRVLQGISRDYAEAEQAVRSVQQVQADRREVSREWAFTRRDVLRAGALGATAAAVGTAVLGRPLAAAAATPRIAIIGAGVAGLNAALTLQDGTNKVAAYASTIFEAQGYIGGRMHSDTASWANGQVSE